MSESASKSKLTSAAGVPIKELSSGVNQCIELLMRRHNIDERSQASLIARLIGASPLQVRRRLAGTSGQWSLEDVLTIASYFGESVDSVMTLGGVDQKPKGVSASVDISGEKHKCQAWLGPPIDNRWKRLCAMRTTGDTWVVGTEPHLRKLNASATKYAVDRLEYIDESISSVRVAIVDDDGALAYGLQAYFEELGYQAKAFTNEKDIAKDIGSFDAFIVDYALTGKNTSLSLLSQIRQAHPDAPILLLSGNIKNVSQDRRDDDVMTLTRVLNVQIHYKPADSALLANSIQGALKESRKRHLHNK